MIRLTGFGTRGLVVWACLLAMLMWAVVPAFAQDEGEDSGDEKKKDGGEQPPADGEPPKEKGQPGPDPAEMTKALQDVFKSMPGALEAMKEAGITGETGADGDSTKSATTPRPVPNLDDKSKSVSIDFTDTDIKQIVKIMSEMTGKNFMIDKNVAGTVTIISPTKVTPREAYDIFMSVLAVNGLTTVDVGGITKIIPIKDAQTSPIATNTAGVPRSNDQFITQLVPLKNIDANDVATAFRGLVSADGNIFAYGPSNMVIVLDSASNITRLMKILQRLDVAGADQEVIVIPLEYASADILADVVLELFEQPGAKSSGAGASPLQARLQERRQALSARRLPGMAGQAGASASIAGSDETKVIADTRTNSLIVKASKFGVQQIRELVAKLDTPLPGGEGKIHVVYLENADAEELAGTLAELAGGSAGGMGGTAANRRQGQLGNDPRSQALGGLSGRGGASSSMARGLTGALGGRSGAAGLGSSQLDRRGTSGIAATSGRFLADFDGAVRITAEASTNSLVIIASNRDFKILKEVIDKLDIPRRQVFVEALIMEISVDRGLDLGFEFRSTNDVTEEGVQVIGGTNYGGIQQAAANPLGVSGFAIGAADGTITFAGETFPNIGALFRAMATDQDVNVLSTPHVLTLDNEEAQVVVANNIPFITGQIFSANNSNPTTTIERQDVGITLRITPQINESDMVKLLIYQEVSQVTDSPEGLSAASVGVTTAKRTADTVVVVKDRQTVIIGGLLKDQVAVVESKVPVLGDIPLLGYLFKTSKTKVQKTNLLIFLTPYIIKDSGDLEEVTRLTNARKEIFREKNHIPDRNDDMRMFNYNNLTPRQSNFQAPLDDTIETDPRLRRLMEEQSQTSGDTTTGETTGDEGFTGGEGEGDSSGGEGEGDSSGGEFDPIDQ
ncbi:MAG: type II secretion system secretin GspD [Deltaproteobacteria bacterium]|nr:type II secretion system secretin GspD [Deltaproteobacteria bacterium]